MYFKNYFAYTSIQKKILLCCSSAERAAKKTPVQFQILIQRTNSNLSKTQEQELIFLLTYFMDSQEEDESCQCFFTAWD